MHHVYECYGYRFCLFVLFSHSILELLCPPVYCIWQYARKYRAKSYCYHRHPKDSVNQWYILTFRVHTIKD
jgi:hypothetical protein